MSRGNAGRLGQRSGMHSEQHDQRVGDEETDVAAFRGLAAAHERLEAAALAAGPARHHHLTIRETSDGLWIAAALVVNCENGREVERTLSARNGLDREGWTVEREVLLNESPVGEPVVIASQELPVMRFTSTADLAAALPDLLGEVLDAATPDSPSA